MIDPEPTSVQYDRNDVLEAAARIVEAVTVKPLVWVNAGDGWQKADGLGCEYWAETGDDTSRQQADYEARILAAIELTPTPVDASPAPDPVSKTELTNDERLEYQHALIWCSAAADFAPEGQAREGWLKLCKPLIDRMPVDPVSKTPTLDAMAMRTAAMKCCDVVFDEAGVEIEAVAASVIRYAISALPLPSPADAALAEAMALPEVVALVEAATPYISPVQNADYARQLRQHEALVAALAALKGASHE